jgi:eukaryotic-like serine/threonine-protein kinase
MTATADPPAGPDGEATRARVEADRPSIAIGPYRLLHPVGEGGMGEVWLAEQTAPVRRQVAIKLIKAGMDTARVVARFEAERQALALMEHPAIAKVFDAGATPQGRPYFVMEYVRGEAITTYCNRNRLSTADRIDLFLLVCDAVQHAHHKGIIHRDLKPSNILVAMLDGRPVPKIIDFGVAKAMTQPLTDRTLFTEIGTLVGTPEYMSPEQAEMTEIDIDTRTDVYALGAILYELLTGMLPFEGRALRSKGLEEIRRTIRDVEPLRPSARITSGSGDASQSRRPNLTGVANQLRGDLDWITMRALEKDRTRRYGSAAELAADLRRHLQNHPVVAGPPGTRYRAGKFVRRHRVGVGVAATLAALLVAFAVTTTMQAQRIARERDRANREAATARAVNDFLQNDLLAQASANTQARPDNAPDPDLKVRTALDRAATRIDGKFGGQPLVEAAVRQTIGMTYRDLGLWNDAQRQLERALELRRQSLGQQHPDTLATAGDLGFIYRRQGKYSAAEQLLTPAVEASRRVRGESDTETLSMMETLAGLYREQAKFADAQPLLEKVLDIRRRVNGADNPETLTAMNNLGLIYWNEGNYASAEPMYTTALELRRRVSGADHPETLTVMNNLATLYYRKGDYARAEPLLAEVLAARTRILGPEHPATLTSTNNLAVAYRSASRFSDAEPLLMRTLEVRRRVLGDEHPDTLTSMYNLGTLYIAERKPAQAEAQLRLVLDVRRRVVGKDHPDTLRTMMWLGRLRFGDGDYTHAESLFREALTGFEHASPDNWERYACTSLLGASLAGQRRFEQAEALLISGYEGIVQRKSTIPREAPIDIGEIGQQIIQLYREWHQPAKADEWQQKLAR